MYCRLFWESVESDGVLEMWSHECIKLRAVTLSLNVDNVVES